MTTEQQIAANSYIDLLSTGPTCQQVKRFLLNNWGYLPPETFPLILDIDDYTTGLAHHDKRIRAITTIIYLFLKTKKAA